MGKKALTFQEIIMGLNRYWGERGCLIWQPHNVQVGAGTMNPATFLQVLGPEPWNVGYVEPSCRPADSRYGQNPNRLQHYYQYQVILKPEPPQPVELYLASLEALGVSCAEHDIRLVEDNWESPVLGAWGLGWEIWMNGQEITQFTYFQQSGGFTTNPVAVEITYGLERIAMPLQGVRNFKDIEWAPGISYGDVLLQAEIEYSKYNLDYADVSELKQLFDIYESQVNRLLGQGLVLPAYDYVLSCSHTFNVLDARGAVGVTERAHFFGRMRNLARNVARAYVQQREDLGHPRMRQWVLGGDLPAALAEPAPAAPDRPLPFLLEIGVEELPAGDLQAALDQLLAHATQKLQEARLSPGAVSVSGTPRRLALYVETLAPCQPDEEEELKGPPTKAAFDAEGKPTKAAEGFARSAGVPVSALEVRAEGNKEYVTARVRKTGRPAHLVLADMLPKLVAGLTFSKSMRWNESGVSFSRPLRWMVALLGEHVVPFEYAGVTAGRLSRGLRPRRSPSITIADAQQYFAAMQANGILVDAAERRASIQTQAVALAASVGGRLTGDAGLLDEVTSLVEQPKALLGHFEEDFLALPEDVLIAVMKKHQRYFPVLDAGTGKMLPYFIVTANGADLDEALVRNGNEEVLRARFADASFFFKADSAKRLEEFLPRLETLVFQVKLGTMRDKSRRIEKLVPALAEVLALSAEERAIAGRAAVLCKADLATQMVIEMTSLQGVMGREYAARHEPGEVAQAIYEHYLPRSAGDALPASRPGVLLALADRIDSLIGLFAIGAGPTSSADPFGLRRAALGIVQIVIEERLSLSLADLMRVASAVLPVECPPEALSQALEFIAGRLRGWLLDQGWRYDLVEAALGECRDDPYRAYGAVQALSGWVARTEWSTLLAAFSRCVRIVRGQEQQFILRPDLLSEPATAGLYQAYLACRQRVSPASSVDELMQSLWTLVEPINRFFEDVLVMAEDQAVREARLALLQGIAGLTAGIVDLRKVEGF